MFCANAGACVGSGMPAAAPAAEAACLPRLAIGDRLECIALFGEANGVMLLGNEARPTKVSKGRGLSGVFGRERNLALAAGDDALPFGLAALNLAPTAGAARDVPRLPCAEAARTRSSSGAERTFGPCVSMSSPTCCRKALEASSRPWVHLENTPPTKKPYLSTTSVRDGFVAPKAS